MNVCVLSGTIANHAVVKGEEPKILRFTLETKQGAHDPERKERTASVPCVMFNPSDEMEQRLVSEGKGLYVELEGRIHSFSYEVNGERRISIEVVVFNRSLTIMKA